MSATSQHLPSGWTRVFDSNSGVLQINAHANPPFSTWDSPSPSPRSPSPTFTVTPTLSRTSSPEVSDLEDRSGPATADPANHDPAPPPNQANVLFNALELQQMTAVTIEVNPYMAKHGDKGKRWAEVADELHAQNLCLESNATTIQHKVEALEALIAYHKKPGPCSHIAKALEKRPSIATCMPAKLEELTGLKAHAAQVSNEMKDKVREEEEKKKAQGEYIRDKAMRTVDKNTASESDSEGSGTMETPQESETGSNKENTPSKSTSKRKAHPVTSKGRKTKRRRTGERCERRRPGSRSERRERYATSVWFKLWKRVVMRSGKCRRV
ncbi:hypothetical protein C8Q76DRAFT_695029 [Earliella scabrosa]|nr:hypothetical protein C8Q76DRAFT_695029 [Earliella scabrosa]